MPKASPTIDRFWEQTAFIGASSTDCWLWTGYKLPSGYGMLRPSLERRYVYAHRFSYGQFIGPIPEGLHIDHLCCNKSCVNPFHLQPVTPQENTLRFSQRRTHCRNGHELTPETTYSRPGRRTRECLVCRHIATAKSNERVRQARVHLSPDHKNRSYGEMVG